MELSPGKLLCIALGGGIGSVLRYLVAWMAARFTDDFPLGTLLVNVTGAALLGFLFAATRRGPLLIDETLYVALTIGLLGGFTTFSTFANETLSFASEREWGFFAVNLLLNNGLALVAAWIGWRLAQRTYGVA